MNITPASISEANAFPPGSYFVDDVTAQPPVASPVDEAPSSPEYMPFGFTGTLQTSIAALEQRFMAFTKMLTRELATLERQFSGALRSLLGAVKHADAAHRSGVTKASASTESARGALPYDGIIKSAAARNKLDPLLVSAVIRQESGFRADAVSPAGALGLMQLMPSTAKELGVADPMNATDNVDGGTRLLRSLLDRYDGRLDLALAAYNAGPSAVDRYGRVPPYPETQSYVQSIMADYRAAALAT